MKDKKTFDPARELFEWAQMLVFAFVSFVLVLTFVAGQFEIRQESMTNTLQEYDRVIISRLPYTPRRGDVILFTKYGWRDSSAETGQDSPLAKRVIGLPGDVIDFDDTSGTLFINGEPQDEPYIKAPMRIWAYELPMPRPVTVEEGCVFVMGDNRNGSHDSRSTDIGLVDRRSILGRVLLRVAPLKAFGPVT
ncbi:MAG: signal peptidase I [Oscillospiraceae bacterium]|jgi:signal peptidase I|nr:signal peptidase I [Oscillospiraceae bacterium]